MVCVHLSTACRLEGEVASLEAHLDGMRSVYMLNADKLEYNMRVLCEWGRLHEWGRLQGGGCWQAG